MTSTARPRFSVRLQVADGLDLAPYDGVPEHLLNPLRSWVKSHFPAACDDDIAEEICLRLRLPSPLGDSERALTKAESFVLLDIVDDMLAFPEPDRSELLCLGELSIHRLRNLLDVGGSAYRVNGAGNGLEERVVPGVRETVRVTVAEATILPTAGSAAEHLAKAWETAYGLQPDPVRSYSESIKAVESAAHSAVQPNHSKATLGSMLGELGNVRPKLVIAFSTGPKSDPVAMVEGMMRTLWEGQTSRHGGQAGTTAETLESARAAVHLAATLVQWFVSGAVSRRP